MDARQRIFNESLEIAFKYPLTGLSISQRVGKTRIGLTYVKEFKRALVVYPKVSIKDSWLAEAEKINQNIDNIDFTTYVSLNKKKPLDYDVLILDECQSLKQSHEVFMTPFVNNGGRVLGLTGTPPKGNFGEKPMMRDKYYPIRYEYTMDEAIDENILNDYRIIVHIIPFGSEKERKTAYWLDSEFGKINEALEKLSEEVFEGTDRMLWLSQQASKKRQLLARKEQIIFQRLTFYKKSQSKFDYAVSLVGDEDKTIVFVNLKDQAEKFTNFYHSSVPKKQLTETLTKFQKGDIRVLAAVAQLSEGITIPGLKKAIMTHAYANNRQFSQRMARTLNLSLEEISIVHVIVLNIDTDKDWLFSALTAFDPNKITIKNV